MGTSQASRQYIYTKKGVKIASNRPTMGELKVRSTANKIKKRGFVVRKTSPKSSRPNSPENYGKAMDSAYKNTKVFGKGVGY